MTRITCRESLYGSGARDATSQQFYEIVPRQSDTWNRTKTQILTVYRKSNDSTEVIVVFPGKEYHIR